MRSFRVLLKDGFCVHGAEIFGEFLVTAFCFFSFPGEGLVVVGFLGGFFFLVLGVGLWELDGMVCLRYAIVFCFVERVRGSLKQGRDWSEDGISGTLILFHD